MEWRGGGWRGMEGGGWGLDKNNVFICVLQYKILHGHAVQLMLVCGDGSEGNTWL